VPSPSHPGVLESGLAGPRDKGGFELGGLENASSALVEAYGGGRRGYFLLVAKPTHAEDDNAAYGVWRIASASIIPGVGDGVLHRQQQFLRRGPNTNTAQRNKSRRNGAPSEQA
jgi:hypothetical protein